MPMKGLPQVLLSDHGSHDHLGPSQLLYRSSILCLDHPHCPGRAHFRPQNDPAGHVPPNSPR